MKSYLHYFKLRLITNIQYRAAALAGISTQIFFGFMYIMLYIALYESNKGVSVPMNLDSVITYLWLGQSFFALTHPYIKDNELLAMIKNGNLAYEIIRPQNFYLKFYIKMYANRIVAVMLRFYPIIIISVLLPKPYNLGAPVSIGGFIIFLIALFLSSLLVNALTLFVHLLTMFLIDSRGAFSFYSVISEIFMGMVVPLPLMPKVFRVIGYFLPFRCISDFPYRVYMGDITISNGLNLLLVSLIWIIIVIYLGYKLSKLALRKAVIQGG